MIMCEPDPDVIRWNLHLLQGEPSTRSEFCVSDRPSDARVDDRECASEHNFRADSGTVENDEMIAHALQEEYSQLAAAEASGNSNTGEEQMRATVLAQDWSGPSITNFVPGNVPIYEVTEYMEPSNSGSSPDEKLYDGEEHLIELTDDFAALDSEVGKRLNQMVPVPHVPRTIGEIPSVDEATTDYQRLLDRLRLYNLVERKVAGDGNCQFRALSDQFYRSPEHHKFVRQQVVNQLKSDPEAYEGYVLMPYADYLERMSKNGEWGDHVTLQAAADAYGVKIFILTSFKDTCYIEILPKVQKSKRVIFLSFWAEVHYNSIYPEGELPASEPKKKKRDFLSEQLSSCSLM